MDGVDRHEHGEDLFQGVFVHEAVAHDDFPGDDRLRERAVELLVDLLLIHLRRVDADRHEQQSHDGQKPQQDDGQLRVERPEDHRPSSGGVPFGEFVPDAPHGEDVAGTGGIFFDLRAEPVDVGIHGVFVAVVAVSPYRVQELGTGEDPSGTGGEIEEEVELLRRERDGISAAGSPSAARGRWPGRPIRCGPIPRVRGPAGAVRPAGRGP